MIFQRGMEALGEDDQRSLLVDLLDREWPGLEPDAVDQLRQHFAGGARHASQQLGDRLARLDWSAVDRNWKDAIDLVSKNPEGAITAARTALERVCKHICEERNEPYPDGGDLSRLYKAAARSLKIAPDQHAERVVKQILSGAATVVDGLAGLRNALSDAHGRGKEEVRPAPRHARLSVNMAFGLATFLIDTHIEKP
jgi:Abortive infection C-terminus